VRARGDTQTTEIACRFREVHNPLHLVQSTAGRDFVRVTAIVNKRLQTGEMNGATNRLGRIAWLKGEAGAAAP
jgi:hypothetical protein